MQQDVTIIEQQKLGKQGRDNSIKQVCIQSPYISFSLCNYGKRSM